jgi:hypothetical protein
MRVVISAHNGLGLPTSYSLFEVVLVRIGEPDKVLFEAPTGYRKIR